MRFIDTLGDGWTIYLWLLVGGAIIIVSLFGIRWAWRNEQFDEDIKYLVFTESDEDKMTPAEYRHSREVLATQMASRERHLREQAEMNRPPA
jgi:nitrogen fixation-related uncharacterized protein